MNQIADGGIRTKFTFEFDDDRVLDRCSLVATSQWGDSFESSIDGAGKRVAVKTLLDRAWRWMMGMPQITEEADEIQSKLQEVFGYGDEDISV